MTRPSSLRPNHWKIAPPAPAELRKRLNHLHPTLLQVLYNRQLSDEAHIQAFLEGRYLESEDPFLLPDMEKAVARIEQAIERGEQIVVYGDFDADGVTATVLLVEALRGLGLSRRQAIPYIPDRVDEGYGLNSEALLGLREKGAGLVISVDCGIRSIREVQAANDVGLDMIVTDHHSLGRALPPAQAVINPKRPDSDYPERMLAGVGIAYKLAQALKQAMPRRVTFEEADLLDLVALGTVADLAPLRGENRRLVIAGLEVLNECKRPGVAALVNVSGLRPGHITAENIGFGLGPRINAAGRLAHAYDAAKLLASKQLLTAGRYAQSLNALNQQRRRLTRQLSQQAEELVSDDAPILIAAHPDFVSGVVGLVASRLAEKHYRPAIVMEQGETESRGSCRSIPDFHITEALDEVADLLERHGGHAQAAGFTVRNENLELFRRRLQEVAAERLDGLDLKPTLEIDAELPLSDVDWALHELLAQLEPTGQANTTPTFVSRGVQVLSHRAVGDGSHLQLNVTDGQQGLRAIAFRQGDWAATLPRRINLVYTIGVNEWNGRRNLQLVVQDIQPAEEQRIEIGERRVENRDQRLEIGD
ncbi:MAG TPA: single-stranded-DNA-specific exonuclease RecJ [Candidatus Sulfomarinibacteraceae bacterium]|nr:single-stranded-DNA-specific exonuclease RecJ [Candidatus Sulfomarinibacteraceae bacterium]